MSKEIVEIPPIGAYSTGLEGALGLVTGTTIEWEKCRDRFQTKSEFIKSFLFLHTNGTGDNVIEFIKTFEQACSCPDGQELQIKKTNRNNVLWIGLSDWWSYRVRRSLLTALLRCGQNFTKRNGKGFEEALNSLPYLSSTKDAVEYFMSGHTACKISSRQSFPGWQHFFSNKTKNQIETCLVKLKRKKKNEN